MYKNIIESALMLESKKSTQDGIQYATIKANSERKNVFSA
jgi:hypothetical protein